MGRTGRSVAELNQIIEVYNDTERYPSLADVADKVGIGVSRLKHVIADTRSRDDEDLKEAIYRGNKPNPTRDPAIQDAMNAFGLETDPSIVWLKNKEFSVQIKQKKEEVDQKSFIDRVQDAFANIPAAPRIEAPAMTLEDKMTVYPFFDVHLGLLAHAQISGEEMNLELGVERVKNAMVNIMATSPNSRKAIIINGGDFTHQNDSKNMTPKSGHILDVAARNIITTDEAVELIAALIEMALMKHEEVEYYSVPGNHDPDNWATILIGLKNRYRGHNRVTIDFTKEKFNQDGFSVVEHGGVVLFIHHGDKRPPKDLVMICMARYRAIFGRSKFCVLMTGHLHHYKAEEFPGITWMQLPAITVKDHHATAYESLSQMMSITYDYNQEIGRSSLVI